MKHHSAAVDFSNLDFEKIDTEILEDEFKEPERDESGIPEKDKATNGKNMDESSAPPSQFIIVSFLVLFSFFFYLENNSYPLVLGFYIFNDEQLPPCL